MITSIDWLNAEYEGSGDNAITLTAETNEGTDRTIEMRVKTIDGSIERSVTVTQEGRREEFVASDGEFNCTDGKFNVLKGSLLPEGYTELEYLENTDKAYINTGICISNETGAFIDMEYTSTTDMIVFGGQNNVRANVNPLNGNFEMSMNTKYTFMNVAAGRHSAWYNYKNDRKFVLDQQNTYTLTDTKVFTNERSAYLFAAPWTSTNPAYFFVGKVYKAVITQGDEIVRDYVPCINPDGEYGMYDLVGKQFYGNANSNNRFYGETK